MYDTHIVSSSMSFSSVLLVAVELAEGLFYRVVEELMEQVRQGVQAVVGNVPVRVDLVWDPPWDLSRMSDAARLELDLTNEGW